ncbi:MAG TPA: thioredoxin domain-containing protein [Gemmatimonadaceae bacterium]|nr:thioredoxin domain-containing protein [Gemmatimonadaceae bacterium]
MPQPQVNRTCGAAVLWLALACTPANGKQQNSESTTVVRAETAAVAAATRAPTDSNITRADLARIQGSPTAPLWVIEVSDFQCPYCKQWHDETYPMLRDQYVKTGKIRLAYVNFPLAMHNHAFPAAEAAMCAGAQDKFWQMHDALFSTQHGWEDLRATGAVFDSLAQSTGVDMTRWRDCMKSGKMRALIEADHDRAERAGASATPTFMIGNKLIAGAQPLEEFRKLIDSAMVRNRQQ